MSDTDKNSNLQIPAELTRADIHSILFGVLLAMFLSSLDHTIIATAMPTIGHELGDADYLSWVATIYLLTSTTVTPLYGKFADIRGRRVTILVALGSFIIGSIACAMANNMFMLIIARGFQGLGGGGLIALSQTIIADIIAPSERGRYMALFAIVFASSSLLGPAFGGFFAEYLHWSIIFWINVPLGIIAFFIINNRLRKLPRHDRAHSVDLLGAALLMIATILLFLTLNWGGIRYPWGSYQILCLFGGSMWFWLMLAIRLKYADEPLIPPALLKNQVVRTGVLSSCFGIGTYMGLTIYLPVFFEMNRGMSASESGLALMPLTVCSVIGAQISGRTLSKRLHYKHFSLIGLFMSMIGCLILMVFAHTMPFIGIELVLAVITAGVGTLFPISTVAIQNAVPMQQLGTVTATSNFFRSLGSALIVALFGALLLSGTASGILTSSGAIPPLASIKADIIADVFRYIFGAAAAGFGLAFLFLLMMEERPLKGRKEISIHMDEK